MTARLSKLIHHYRERNTCVFILVLSFSLSVAGDDLLNELAGSGVHVCQQAPIVSSTWQGISIDLDQPWGIRGSRRQVVMRWRGGRMCPYFPLTFSNGTVSVAVGPASQEKVRQPLGPGLLIGGPRAEEGWRRGWRGWGKRRGGVREGGRDWWWGLGKGSGIWASCGPD